jgi:hypothetical protein
MVLFIFVFCTWGYRGLSLSNLLTQQNLFSTHLPSRGKDICGMRDEWRARVLELLLENTMDHHKGSISVH